MLKKFNRFMYLTLAITLIFAILGIVFTVYPTISLKIISYVIACSFVITGAFLINESTSKILFGNFASTGILTFVLGIVILIYPGLVSTLMPIMVGIWIITSGIVNINFAVLLKNADNTGWFLSFLLAIFSIICGVLVLINPVTSAVAITGAFGIILFLYSLSNIINIIIFKNNINTLISGLDL